MFELYPYQNDFKHNLGQQYAGGKRRVLGVAPTGSGKTVVFASIVLGALAKGGRIYILAHRTEICDQICSALAAMAVPHGRIQAKHPRTEARVQVGMVQTVANRVSRLEAPDFVVVDEAHHAIAGSYMKILEAWPDAKVLGMTATPLRLDGRGLGKAFDSMVVGPSTRELIDLGKLAEFDYYASLIKPDLTGVATVAGDYNEGQLAVAMDKPKITGDAIEHYRRHLHPRTAIAFCVRVSHAESVARQFREAGYRAQSIDGTMDQGGRQALLGALADGSLDVLTSCALISEGLDVPSVGGVILLRPTKSLAMHLQQIGRALRVKAGGARAVVLDHVGNVERHGMPDAARLWTLEDQPKRSTGDIVCAAPKCGLTFKNRPNWKEHAKALMAKTGQRCPWPADPRCALRVEASQGVPLLPPAVVDGQLQRLTARPDWAKGINIATARGRAWFTMIGLADTEAKLRQIMLVRGYSKGWLWHQMQDLRARQRGVPP